MSFNSKGLSKEEIRQRLQQFRTHDVKWREGRVWTYVYHAGDDVEEVAKMAYNEYLTENGIDVTAFPSLKDMENEVIGMCRELLRGDEQVCGSITSGGTESLLLAAKTARDYARAHKPHITQPEIILAETIHSSFFKAAHYFGLKPVVVPARADHKVHAEDIAGYITDQTVLITASFPSYAYAVPDPIAEIGQLALEKNILFHVDGCIGGFIGALNRLNGMIQPDFDFSVPGVTSISMDLHKYGYTPKGASVIMYKNETIRRYQYFVCNEWTGYTVVNPTMLSSKSGGPIAAAWAVMRYIGLERYKAMADETMRAVNTLKEGIKNITGLELIGSEQCSLICFRPTKANVYDLVDELREKNWVVNLQFGHRNVPPNIHLTITYQHIHRVHEFLNDLEEALKTVSKRVLPKLMDMAKLKTGKALVGTLDTDTFAQLAPLLGIKDGELPVRMAVINELLNDLPKEVTKELLLKFMSDLYKAD